MKKHVAQLEPIIKVQKGDRILSISRKGYGLVEVELEQVALNKSNRYSVVADMSLETLEAAYAYSITSEYKRARELELVLINGRTVILYTKEHHRRKNQIMLFLQYAGEGSVTRTWLECEQSEIVPLLAKSIQALKLHRPPRVN